MKLSERLRFLFQVLARALKSLDIKGIVQCQKDIRLEVSGKHELDSLVTFVMINMPKVPIVPDGLTSLVNIGRHVLEAGVLSGQLRHLLDVYCISDNSDGKAAYSAVHSGSNAK